jgi:hypothetical protein
MWGCTRPLFRRSVTCAVPSAHGNEPATALQRSRLQTSFEARSSYLSDSPSPQLFKHLVTIQGYDPCEAPPNHRRQLWTFPD